MEGKEEKRKKTGEGRREREGGNNLGGRKFKQIFILKMIWWGTDLLKQIPVTCLFNSPKVDYDYREENNEKLLHL